MNSRKFLLQAKFIHRFFLATAFASVSVICAGQNLVAVAPTRMNVFYVGVENPISVASSGNSDDAITVSISGAEGTVSKTSAGLYSVRVSTITDNCAVNIYANGKLVGTSFFRVRYLPPPTVGVGGFTSGTKLSKEVLKAQVGLSAFVKDVPFEVGYTVTGFTLTLVDNANEVKQFYCDGAAFSDEAKQAMSDYLKPGDIVTIQNIRAKGMDGKEIKFPAVLYVIE